MASLDGHTMASSSSFASNPLGTVANKLCQSHLVFRFLFRRKQNVHSSSLKSAANERKADAIARDNASSRVSLVLNMIAMRMGSRCCNIRYKTQYYFNHKQLHCHTCAMASVYKPRPSAGSTIIKAVNRLRPMNGICCCHVGRNDLIEDNFFGN